MSVLAIDIGNSRVGFGVFTAGKSKDPAVRWHHAELDAQLADTLRQMHQKAIAETQAEDDETTGVVITSVVPELTQKIRQAVATHLQVKPVIVGQEVTVPIKTKLRDETTVGQDRLVAALAAYVNLEKACVIVQVGSALVVDCIDDEGIFRGGAIAPGLQMGAKALHEFAAQLPDVSLTPPDDAEPFGRYTQEAINLGLYAGARGCVRELVERYATAIGHWPHVVATGGDALTLLQDMQIVDSFVPDLVLQGAALAWEHYHEG
ncbi:MAG: type III pantothenate kinase [Phycisphaerae bacterium]